MTKFKFRLATLLQLREAARDERRSELAEVYRLDELLQERLDDVLRQLGSLRGQCRRVAAPGAIDVDQLVEAQRYELTLRSQQKLLEQQRLTVTDEIERRRQVLVDANRDVRVLEKLRDKQSRRHREEEGRREIKQLDEVAGQRVARGDVR
ncbi:MAG: flagellar export protein FliJ [Pirellulales bacterium]|nr:flagellar export protein FliJ [Pirellulales bacterium]